MTGELDEDSQNTYLLNDFYETDLDDYRSGSLRYPLAELEEGRHSIKVRAWDVANNVGEGYTEFIVSPSAGIALKRVLNYPNPFIDNTCFQFEHNMENTTMDVRIQIYTVAGRLVKTLQESINTSSSRLGLGDCISWDGKDDFGDPLAKGVYIYKVSARVLGGSQEIKGESEYEKLVILK